MMFVFFRQDNVLVWYQPIDIQVLIVPQKSSFALGGVVVVAFILEDGCLAQDRKSVGETVWNEKQSVVVLGKLYGHVFSVCWRAFAYIYGYTTYAAFHTTHQLCLGIRRRLEMQSSYHTIARF